MAQKVTTPMIWNSSPALAALHFLSTCRRSNTVINQGMTAIGVVEFCSYSRTENLDMYYVLWVWFYLGQAETSGFFVLTFYVAVTLTCLYENNLWLVITIFTDELLLCYHNSGFQEHFEVRCLRFSPRCILIPKRAKDRSIQHKLCIYNCIYNARYAIVLRQPAAIYRE